MEPAGVGEVRGVLLDDDEEGVGGQQRRERLADRGDGGLGDRALLELGGRPAEGLLGDPADDEGQGDVAQIVEDDVRPAGGDVRLNRVQVSDDIELIGRIDGGRGGGWGDLSEEHGKGGERRFI